MFNIVPLTRTALKDLAANKLRSFLTMLGIIIGIASVILVMAIGEGAQQLIISQVTTVGTDLVGVLPGKSDNEGPPLGALGGTITTLKRGDAEAMEDLPHIKSATPYVQGRTTVSYDKEAKLYDLMGVGSSYLKVENANIEKGYFFNEKQTQSYAQVVVLGSEVAEDLFYRNPLGESIKIKGRTFRVIGVLEKRGNTFFGNLDQRVFVPVTTAQKDLLGINHVNLIRGKVTDPSKMSVAQEEIERLLSHRHNIPAEGKEDFTVMRMDQLLKILGNVTGAIQAFLILVVAISLLVGGIGIMNIMLASLSERIREIGVRKAVGAKNQDILTQFLIESTLLSIIGGSVGIILGVGLGFGIAHLIRYFTNFAWYFLITPWQIALAVGVTILVGLLFGLYPARKAAQLDPIEALRYE
ncbi:MAG: ABC transporter permease [Candidatus Paceibacterota bacterium]